MFDAGDFAQSLHRVKFPNSLEELDLGSGFDRSIWGVEWAHTSLKRIHLEFFNRPIVDVEWPNNLVELEFGDMFNFSISSVLPRSLRKVKFDKPIVGVLWAETSLTDIEFGTRFNQPIAGVMWPRSLEKLVFGSDFNQSIGEVEWVDTSLTEIHFGQKLKAKVSNVVWPSSLQLVCFVDVDEVVDLTGV